MNDRGFTLIEILTALGITSLLLLAFVRFYGSTLQTTHELHHQSELLHEGDIAHQLIASRIKEAWYIFPKGTKISLAQSGWTTQNRLENDEAWTVGETFLALILPPEREDVTCSENVNGCFRFFAYYPLPRWWYVQNANAAEALDKDPQNDAKVWVLMEYRSNYRSGCPVTSNGNPDPSNTGYRGRRGRLLVDYVQPLQDPWNPTFNYTLFEHPDDPAPSKLTLRLRLARKTHRRLYRVPREETGLTLSLEARNHGLKASLHHPYCQ